MSIQRFGNRAFERVLRNPPREKGLIKDREEPRRYFFERLMEVSIYHSYYNGEKDDCPDFRVFPTPSTAAFMKSLGLVFKESPNGFTVFYNTKQKDDLIQFLERQTEVTDSLKPGIWTRLSFALALTNQFFVNFTSIDIQTNPALENFYFTNQKVHPVTERRIILHPETFVTERETLEVTPIQVPIIVTQQVKRVEVRAISNEVKLCFPRCFPKSLLLKKSPNAITCKDAASAKGEEVCRDILYIDFSMVSEDKYVIQLVGKHRKIIDSQEVLYTIAYPVPLCFVNLLFTSPDGKNPSHYPVQTLPDGTTKIVPIQYDIKFKARSTYWNYYMVPQRPDEVFDHLQIKDLTPDQEPIQFAGPCCVILANGAKAYRFISTAPIQLQQHSKYYFQLWGRHGLMTQPNILIERLPVASIQQVLPETKTATCLNLLKSLCPNAVDDSTCQTLIKQLCPFSGEGMTGEARLDHIKQLTRAFNDEQQAGLQSRRPKIQNFSDIFVYL